MNSVVNMHLSAVVVWLRQFGPPNSWIEKSNPPTRPSIIGPSIVNDVTGLCSGKKQSFIPSHRLLSGR